MPVIPFIRSVVIESSLRKADSLSLRRPSLDWHPCGQAQEDLFVMHGKERRIETIGKYPAITLRPPRIKAVTSSTATPA